MIMKSDKAINWNDITLNKYLEIQSIEQSETDILNKNSAYINIVFDIPYSENIYIKDYNKYTRELAFLSTPIPTHAVKTEYGKYHLDKNISHITMAQFIDFKTYAQQNDMLGCLSVFLRPKNTNYLEGYDIEEVKEYIGNMPIADVLAVYTFFLNYLKRYTTLSLIYLHLREKTLKRNPFKSRLKKLLPTR